MATTILTDKSSASNTRSTLSLESELKNPVKVANGGQLEHARILWDFFFNKPADTRPSGQIPVQRVAREQLLNAPNNTIYRLGHSTVLMRLDDAFWITDPMFSGRASPTRFFGPERFHAPPISIAELPPIKGVIISHDHYDHLDRDSIMQLAGKADCFLTPLGVGEILINWGVPVAKVRQLDWWGTMPMTVFTFLESYDFTGKLIVPYCTHERSGLGRSEHDIKKLCPTAKVLPGLAIKGSTVASADNEVAIWLKKLELK